MSSRRLSLIVGYLGMIGCGADPRLVGADAPESLDGSRLEFRSWCENWQLNCPDQEPEDVPIPGAPWSVAQWQAAFRVLSTLSQTSSSIQLTRAELDAEPLNAMASALGLEQDLTHLKDQLSQRHFDELRIHPAGVAPNSQGETLALTLHASEPSTVTATSGLTVTQADEVALGIDVDQNVQVRGIAIGPQSSPATAAIEELTVTETNILRWSGSTTSVDRVPIAFFLRQILAFDGQELPAPRLSYRDLVPAAYPFIQWLTSGERDIAVPASAFQAVAQQLPVISPTPYGRGFGSLLGYLAELRSTRTSRAEHLLLARVEQAVVCRFGKLLEIIPDREFGIREVTALSATSFRTSFFGVSVKLPLLPIVPRFRIKQIDFEPTKIVLYDVPVFGRYEYDMSSNSLPNLDLTPTCKSALEL